MNELDRLGIAAGAVRERIGDDRLASIRLGLVCGSGLKGFAERLEHAVRVPFDEVPEWPVPQVEGHGGALVVGSVAGAEVACLTGRVHLYEGWTPADVVRPVRTLRRLGVAEFLLTNAAGGIGDELSAGDLMVLTDHLNLTGQSPLVGPHVEALGPRFPDQTHVYAVDLRAELATCGVRLRPGVYAGLLGPSYETPAEIRMLKAMGADAVGMSTVHEAIALNAMGAQVAGISLITNLAAGIAEHTLSHDEVMAAGGAGAASLADLVNEYCRRLS